MRRAAATMALLVALPFLSSCFNHAPLALPIGMPARPVVEESASYVSEGERIQVDVYRPTTTSRHLTVLLLHGSAGIHDLGPQQITRYASTLASLGVTAFVLHYFDGTRHFMANEQDERRFYWQWVQHVRDGISWVLQQPYVHDRTVSLLGLSLGAWLSVGVGSVDARVHRIALIGSGLEPTVRDSLVRAPAALLLHGAQDDVVPLADARALLEALNAHHRRAQLYVYPRESHTLGDSASLDALLRSVRFLSRQR